MRGHFIAIEENFKLVHTAVSLSIYKIVKNDVKEGLMTPLGHQNCWMNSPSFKWPCFVFVWEGHCCMQNYQELTPIALMWTTAPFLVGFIVSTLHNPRENSHFWVAVVALFTQHFLIHCTHWREKLILAKSNVYPDLLIHQRGRLF